MPPRPAVSSLLYVSLAPWAADDALVRTIVHRAQELNAAAGVSGALMLHAGYCLQLIEGERAVVLATFDRIRRDPRHFDVRRVALTSVDTPLFAGWPLRRLPTPAADDAALAALLKRLWRGLGGSAQAVAARALMHQMVTAGEQPGTRQVD